VARLLQLTAKTIHLIAQTGQIPAFKVRGQWRFKHDGIDRWIDEQKAVVKGNVGRGTTNA